MKALYIQPETQLQPMHTTSLICASGGMSVSGNAGLGMGGAATPGSIDPL